jgi:hypothetical protein
MMLRAISLVGGLLMFAAAGVACSSADTPEDDSDDTSGGSSGSAGTATGGSAGTPSGGSAGTPASGGSAGTAAGGSAGTAAGGSAGTPAGCTGISRGEACPTEGHMCPGLKCGLADSGTRSCSCVGLLWECESCNFAGQWTEMKPPTVEPCPAGIADEIACTAEQDHLICGPDATSGEYCACWMSPSDGQSWDCDDPPSTWPE